MDHASPSTSREARRLGELLEEQQEPFSLDLYLLERGYSTNFLESKTTRTCWPSNETKILKRLTNNGRFGNKRRGDGDRGVSKRMMPKFLHGKFANKSLYAEGITSVSNRFYLDEMQKDFEQFSPVSVLELRSSYESSPVSSQREEENQPKGINLDPQIMNIFKELLEAAYTSEFEKFTPSIHQDQHKKSPNLNCARNSDERIWESKEKKEKIKRDEVEDDDSLEIHRVELERLSKVICREISETPKWRDFHLEIEEIAIDMENALFEEIVVDLCSL